MKRSIYILITSSILFVALAFANPVIAQDPPHPPTAGHGVNGNQNPSGTSAPIGGGLGILMAFGLAYSVRKSFKSQDESK